MPRHEAMYYEEIGDGEVRCRLCPHHCRLRHDEAGLCGVRVNEAGRLISINYGEIASLALDPIEKKPLYHFYPASNILSVGSFGCNLFCPFCQNYLLAHAGRFISDGEKDSQTITTSHPGKNPGQQIPHPRCYARSSEWLINLALDARQDGSIGVAFTYNEPSIWYEYVLEGAARLHDLGQKVVLVTNGYIEKAPLRELLPVIDAMNIDVKAFSPDFYHRHCRGQLKAVMDTLEQAAGNCHVEITTLVIPGENDNIAEIEALAHWLAALNPNIPLHLSRYHPAFTFRAAPTPESTLQQAKESARRYLNFVYLGNLGGETNSTCCLNCGGILVQRNGYQVRLVNLKNHSCAACGQPIDYIKN